MRAIVDIENVSKSFATKTGAVHALAGVSVSILDNEFFTLLGPSGCGKTTLLRVIAGFEMPTQGGIRIGGMDAARLPPQKRPVNTVFQSYALFPHMSVGENVGFGLEMQGRPRGEIAGRVREVLKLVKLEEYAERNVKQLSGGQQQRVALARALAPRPQVLLLDEPLSALDLKLRKEMQGELKRLQRETGIAFVLVTHDQEEALAMSDRIAVMSGGKILQLGTPREIYELPANQFVADFIGESNLLSGELLGCEKGVMVAVRPERVAIAAAGNGASGRVSGRISAVTFLGLDTMYEVELADGGKVRSRRREMGAPLPGLNAGAMVVVDWPRDVERHLVN